MFSTKTEENIIFKNRKIFFGFFLAACYFLLASYAHAASLYFTPASGSHSVGQTFTVSVYVSSTDQAMNAVSGTVSFPADKLEVVSMPKTGSIISLWVQDPSFSNSSGTANFEGIVLNPGYTGGAGKIISVTFRTKSAGIAPVSFSTSSVLANDGKGTNILVNSGSASFSISDAGEEQTAVSSVGLPAPKITSPTHPDSSQWYARSDATFAWDASAEATKVRLLYDKYQGSQPTVAYDSSVTKKDLTGLSDGVWYFHAQFSNDNERGPSAHFKFQIDTTKPDSLKITEVPREDLTDPGARFTITATDKLSGIDHFEIKVDDGTAEIWNGPSGNTYQTKAVAPGKHTLYVKALDKAGNYLSDSAEFSVEPLKPPVFTDYPKEISEGGDFNASGKTEYEGGDMDVVVWIQKDKNEPKNYTVHTNRDGTFNVSVSKLSRGSYTMWAFVTDKRGARSYDSDKVSFAVTSGGFLVIGNMLISYLSIILILLLLIAAIVLLSAYIWHRYYWWRRKFKEETSEAQAAVTRAFATLRDEIRTQIAHMDGRADLSESEKRIYFKLREALRISERYIARKVKDIK